MSCCCCVVELEGFRFIHHLQLHLNEVQGEINRGRHTDHLAGRHSNWLVRMEWRPAGWSACPPLLISPCTIKSRSSLLAPAHPGGPGKRAVKRLWWYESEVKWLSCSAVNGCQPSMWDIPSLLSGILGYEDMGAKHGRETLILNAKKHCRGIS